MHTVNHITGLIPDQTMGSLGTDLMVSLWTDGDGLHGWPTRYRPEVEDPFPCTQGVRLQQSMVEDFS